MKTFMCVLILVSAVCAGSVERHRAEVESLQKQLEHSRIVFRQDSTYATKVFEDSIRVEIAKAQLADEIEESMEPNGGGVWFTICIGVSATILSIIAITQ